MLFVSDFELHAQGVTFEQLDNLIYIVTILQFGRTGVWMLGSARD
jgi:hypothetical protein